MAADQSTCPVLIRIMGGVRPTTIYDMSRIEAWNNHRPNPNLHENLSKYRAMLFMLLFGNTFSPIFAALFALCVKNPDARSIGT